MKPRLYIAMISMLCIISCSNETEFEIKESEVPPSVLAAFKAKYPNAQVKEWEAEKEDGKFFFEVEFKDGDKEKEVHITPDGASITEEK